MGEGFNEMLVYWRNGNVFNKKDENQLILKTI